MFRVGTGAFALVLVVGVLAIGFELYRQSTLSLHEFGGSSGRRTRGIQLQANLARDRSSGALSIRLFSRSSSRRRLRSVSRSTSPSLRRSWSRAPLVFLTELLAAIPSIVYGLWGVFVLVPVVRQLEIATPTWLKSVPFFSGPPLGIGMLSAALVLAIMIIPFSSSIAREVLKAVPQAQREGAYALGATQWEATRMALFYARTGIVGAIMLGFGRALGETMAVTMVIGNTPRINLSLFAPQHTMSAVIANEFTEASTPLYLHALIEIGLVLFIITLIINMISRAFIWSMGRQPKSKASAPALKAAA